jgi:hypothetical protein
VAYTPTYQPWKNRDPSTPFNAAAVNHMEEGIANATALAEQRDPTLHTFEAGGTVAVGKLPGQWIAPAERVLDAVDIRVHSVPVGGGITVEIRVASGTGVTVLGTYSLNALDRRRTATALATSIAGGDSVTAHVTAADGTIWKGSDVTVTLLAEGVTTPAMLSAPAEPTSVNVATTTPGKTVTWPPMPGASDYMVLKSLSGTVTLVAVTLGLTVTEPDADGEETFTVFALNRDRSSTGISAVGAATAVRSKYLWPFASNSIWNTPRGATATLVAAGLAAANAWNSGEITVDRENISVDPADPLRTLTGTNTGDALKAGGSVGPVSVRTRASMTANGSYNNCSAFLTSDGNSVWQGQPLTLAANGNPSWTYTYPSTASSLTSDGQIGSHGGSHLSTLGGSIRLGELLAGTDGTGVIRHVLKMNVFAHRFLSTNSSGYRWPATSADSYYNGGGALAYGGVVTACRMGSLLTLDAAVYTNGYIAANVTNAKAARIVKALRDYGAYIVDDTAWDVHAFCVDDRVYTSGEWPTKAVDPTFHSQLHTAIIALKVVNDNASDLIGGAGTRMNTTAIPGFA